MRIGIDINRERGYGRGFCEGIASWVEVRGDWQLEVVRLSDSLMALRRLDGLIAHVVDAEAQSRVEGLGIPVVADFYRTGQSGLAQVMPDHRAIGALAYAHFQERGFSSFAFCGYDGILFSDARLDGFRAALAADGRPEPIVYHAPPEVYHAFGERVILGEELGPPAFDAPLLMQWLRSLPPQCAVFCAHDLRAMHVASLARDAGRQVPDDLAILGVDNDGLVCSFTKPRLSSIDNNAFACGRAAAECLDDLLAGKAGRDTIRLVPPLSAVERQSTEVLRYPSKVVNDAIRFMRRNVSRNLSAANIFEEVGTTHTTLDALFQREVGRTVHAELGRLRLAEARRLLATTALPLSEIAARSGFSSVKYFNSVFRAAEGVAPSEWRLKIFTAA